MDQDWEGLGARVRRHTRGMIKSTYRLPRTRALLIKEILPLTLAMAEGFMLLQPVSDLLRPFFAHHGRRPNLNSPLSWTHPPRAPRHDHPSIPRIPIRPTSIGGILQHMLEKRHAPDAISEALLIVTPKMDKNLYCS
jgi:hypothetical protein